MKRMIGAAALALPMLVAGYAAADEPLVLSDTQMDAVTAGGSAQAFADALAFGSFAATLGFTLATVEVVDSFTSEVTRINLIESNSQAVAEAVAN